MQIILLRHGEPDLALWKKIPTSRMPEWIDAYNSAGVKDESESCTRALFAGINFKFMVCSNLPRSIHSGQLLDQNMPKLIDELFREAELPIIKIPLIRLMPHTWSIIFRLFWFAGVSDKVESVGLFKQRVALAGNKLEKLTEEHETVLFTGHGILNRFLAKQLISKGWTMESASNINKYLDYRYWEYTTFTKIRSS